MTYGFEILENIFLQSNAPLFSEDGQEAIFDKTTGLINGRNENLGEKALDFFTSFADDRFRHYTWNEFVAGEQPLADYTEFLKGNVSMVFGFTRDYERLKALRQQIQQNRQTVIPEGDIRVTFLPQFTDPSLPTRKVVGQVQSLAVSKHSQFPDTAWGFLKFAIGKDQLQSWHEKTQLPTPRVDLLVEQEATPYIGIFVRQAKFAEGAVSPVDLADLSRELTNSVNQIQDRKWTVLQGLQKAAANINNNLQSIVRKKREIES